MSKHSEFIPEISNGYPYRGIVPNGKRTTAKAKGNCGHEYEIPYQPERVSKADIAEMLAEARGKPCPVCQRYKQPKTAKGEK